MTTLVYDPQTVPVVTARYHARVYTGWSLGVRNLLTALMMQRQHADRAALLDALFAQCEALAVSQVSGVLDAPGHAYYQPFAHWLTVQERVVVLHILWGFVLRGRPKQGLLCGDFRFVVALVDEHDDAVREAYGARAEAVAQ